MNFTTTLGVSKEELEEFPDFHQSNGILVPDCSQNSLHTPHITQENTTQKETIEEIGSPLPTQSTTPEEVTTTISGDTKCPHSGCRPTVYEIGGHRGRQDV